MVRKSLLLVLFLFLSHTIYGEENGYVTEVKEYRATTENPSGFVEIVEIGDDTRPVDISQEIKSATGIQVNSTGSLDSFSTVMIRGASSKSSDVFINGVKLNSSYINSFNLSLVPDDIVERIEIYKGFVPSKLGVSNTGGAINIVTNRAKGVFQGFRLSYGSFDTLDLSLYTSYKGEDGNYIISFYGRKTDGDFEFLNRNGTPLNTEDDVIERRSNNYKDEYALSFLATNRIGNNLSLGISFLPMYSKGGIPGIENIRTEKALYSSLSNLFSVEGSLISMGLIKDLTAGYSNLYTRTTFDDRNGELNMGFKDIVDTSDLRHTCYIMGNTLFFNNLVTLRLSYTSESIDRVSRLHRNDNKYLGERSEYILSLSDNIEILKDRFFFIPSIDYKWVSDRVEYSSAYLMQRDKTLNNSEDLRNYRVGVFFKVTDELAFKSNISYQHRYPDIYEMFGDGVYTQPNIKLKSEDGRLIDGGFELRTDLLYISYSVFKSDYENLIQFFENSQRTIKADNIAKAEIFGNELSIKPIIHKSVFISINYTHQEPINKTDIPSFRDKVLPFRYTDSLFMNYGIAINRIRLLYEYEYTSQNYFDAANLLPQDIDRDRSVHSISVNYSDLGMEFGFHIKNILDNRMEDIAGYPLPGRMFFIGISKTFKNQQGGVL
jgi:outer membrane receptor protein involved in Fe transport